MTGPRTVFLSWKLNVCVWIRKLYLISSSIGKIQEPKTTKLRSGERPSSGGGVLNVIIFPVGLSSGMEITPQVRAESLYEKSTKVPASCLPNVSCGGIATDPSEQ